MRNITHIVFPQLDCTHPIRKKVDELPEDFNSLTAMMELVKDEVEDKVTQARRNSN